jgi:hypothetical protein
MSNKSRKEKKRQKEQQRLGKTTPALRPRLGWQDMLRVFPGLMLRALVVVMPLTILMTWLGASQVTLFNNFWVQMGVYAASYVLFYNFIFGPVRNYRPASKAREVISGKQEAKKG